MAAPSKSAWRDRALAARALRTNDHDAHVDALIVFLEGLDPAPRWVLTYNAMPGEVDLGGLAGRCSADVAVTRTPETGFDLTVHPLSGPTERHRFGFDQPTADSRTVAHDQIDVVLVPGLAFDRIGNRLGHGAGYYDRLLAQLRPGVPLVGITGGYIVAELPTAPHDVVMTHLASPTGVEATPLPDPIG
ncbi:MAG: 5-formyltetrahydrofolate cyclo-ligase [Acidimicrobiales bacterium]